MTAAEDTERQIAATALVPVEEAPFLSAARRIVDGVQVGDDPLGRPRMSLHKQPQEEPLQGPWGSWLIL